jgi:uncharacterized protein involved in exopolysaccharide biosynthesis
MQEHSDSSQDRRHLSDYFRVVWERRGLVLILFLLTLGGGILFTALQTPVYEATAKVEIQVSPPKLLGGRFEEGTQPTISPWFKESFFQTEFEKIGSRDLLTKVLERKLGGISPFDTAEKPEELLQGTLKLEMIPTTDVAAIRARTADPELSARIANAVAETYVDWTIEKRIDGLTRAQLILQAKIQDEVAVLEQQQAHELEETARQDAYTPELVEAALIQQIEDAQKRLMDTQAEEQRTRHDSGHPRRPGAAQAPGEPRPARPGAGRPSRDAQGGAPGRPGEAAGAGGGIPGAEVAAPADPDEPGRGAA